MSDPSSRSPKAELSTNFASSSTSQTPALIRTAIKNRIQKIHFLLETIPISKNSDIGPLVIALDYLSDILKSMDGVLDIDLARMCISVFQKSTQYPNWWLTQWCFTSFCHIFRLCANQIQRLVSLSDATKPFSTGSGDDLEHQIFVSLIQPTGKQEIRDAAAQVVL